MSDVEKPADEFAFDPTAKKKKSKKKVAFNADEENLLEAGDGDDVLDLSNKVKDTTLEEPQPVEDLTSQTAPTSSSVADLSDFDFTAKKKKKKKVDTSAFEAELGTAEQDGDDDDQNEVTTTDAAADLDGQNESAGEPWLNSDRDYSYKELLGRLFKVHRANNPDADSGEKRKYTIVPPNVQREGSKKTCFANLADIAKRMHRSSEHVIAFIYAELGTTGSIDGAGRLILRGRYQQKQIETVLRRYIMEYVTCKTCRSPDTVLVKENRLFFLDCEQCNSRRSVQAIKTGFSAQIGKRRLLKAQT
ncbi:translation initiation factor eIF-2 beta subunit [Savitreella phatthalungensis]